MFPLPQNPPLTAQAAGAAEAATDAGSPSDATTMNRLLDAVVYGIPDRFHVDCAACLFWRGAAFGTAASAIMGSLAVWWVLE